MFNRWKALPLGTRFVLITVAVLSLAHLSVPLLGMCVLRTNLRAVAWRGRAIVSAIDLTNRARKDVGLTPIWPVAARVNGSGNPIFEPACSGRYAANSTDYFRWLYDEARLGSEDWNPQIADFDYTRLAGAGVSCCTNGRLTAAHNIWMIAQNLHADMPDTTPVLVTRNIDASSLALRVTEKDMDKHVTFSAEWRAPFANKYYVVIRKDGSAVYGTCKQTSYREIYGEKPFDATVDRRGRPYAVPLRYLTPTREASPAHGGL